MDLFASRLNAKLPQYYSWQPDPGATAINALHRSWEGLFGYAFPPFSLIGRVLHKIHNSANCKVLPVCPYWPSQLWFPFMAEMLVASPVVLPGVPSLLRCPMTGATHPLLPQLQLVACLLSSKTEQQQGFRRMLRTSSKPVGKDQHASRMTPSSASGLLFATPVGMIGATPLYQSC